MFNKNIVIGIDENSPIQNLISLGIRQFYGGYIPSSWFELYGSQQSLNRRYLAKEQFFDKEKFTICIETIHQNGGTFALTLNAPFQTAQMLDYSKEVIQIAKEIKVDSLIVGNIALLELLKEDTLPITLSTTLGIYSLASVGFFIDRYHPKRIIFPRDMLKSEIATIVTQYPNIEFEVFLYGDTCRWSDGHCFVEHGYDSIDKGLPFCVHLKNTNSAHTRINLDFKHIITKNQNQELLKTQIIELPHTDDINSKDEFSKTSFASIQESLRFFAKFPNIVGYKIPSRGRDIPKLLSYATNEQTKKHFKTALYK
jgi:hypothetical protein